MRNMENYPEEENDEFLDYYQKYRRQGSSRPSFSRSRAGSEVPLRGHLSEGPSGGPSDTRSMWGGGGEDSRSVWGGGSEVPFRGGGSVHMSEMPFRGGGSVHTSEVPLRGHLSEVGHLWRGDNSDARSMWGGGSEAGTVSSSGYSSGQRLVSRSKSHGRDPRMVDLLKVYGRGVDQVDTVSRDSGNSSGGTPESSRRVVRTSSFPQHGVTKAEVYNNNYRGDTDQTYDSMSLRSLDTHLLDWAPLGAECRKRKFDDFDQTVSDEDESVIEDSSEKLAKRPCTPDIREMDVKPSLVWRVCHYLLLTCVTLVVVICSLVLFVTWRNYQCSSQKSLTLDLTRLNSQLNPPTAGSRGLQGQHLATTHILSSLARFSISESPHTLVLVLLGGVGSGKTFTANLIADIFPVQSNVHRVLGSLGTTETELEYITHSLVRSCGPSMLLLDDITSMESAHYNKILERIAGSHKDRTNSTLVVITTSTGGMEINKYLLDKVRGVEGLSSRERVTRDELLEVLNKEGLNFPILSSLDVEVEIIPFLPLTRDHVRSCVLQSLRQSKATVNRDDINLLLDQLVFFSKQFPVFSSSGCKSVAAKVGLLLGGRIDL